MFSRLSRPSLVAYGVGFAQRKRRPCTCLLTIKHNLKINLGRRRVILTKKAKDYCQIVVQTGCVMLKPFLTKYNLRGAT